MNSIHTLPLRAPLPSLNMLRAFEAVGRHQSVTRAAAELHLTQSAVSHQLKALEDWLGVTLVARQGRGLRLTASGEAYFPSLRSAFDLLAQATGQVARRDHGWQGKRSASLLVGIPPSLASQWLIPRLADFCAQHTGLDVQLNTKEKPLLESSPADFDVTLRCLYAAEVVALPQRPHWQGAQIGAFLPDALVPVCAPTWAGALQTPDGMRHQTLLHSRSTAGAWAEWFAAAGLVPPQGIKELTFDHGYQAVLAASQGLGVALGTPSSLGDMVVTGALVVPFPSLTIHEKQVCWIRSERASRDSLVQAFCAWLEKQGLQAQ